MKCDFNKSEWIQVAVQALTRTLRCAIFGTHDGHYDVCGDGASCTVPYN